MNIAVIRFSALGDVVLSTAILEKLVEVYPGCRIDLVTAHEFNDLFSSDPRIRTVIPYDTSRETAGYMLNFLRLLRREQYDLVIDAHLNPRSVIVSTLARTRRRRRVQKYRRQRRSMVRHHRVWDIPHVVERYLAAVDGSVGGRHAPSLYVDDEHSERIRREIKSGSGRRAVVGIAPGAARRTKMWDTEKLRQLVLSLSGQRGLFPLFLGDGKEKGCIDAICGSLKEGYLNLAGKTNFRELAQYLSACSVVLSADSAAMHVANAVGTPAVALFGPTVPEFGFRPFDERSVTISVDLPCRPCSLHGTVTCPLGHHRCMKEIEVSRVEEAILGLVGDMKGSRE